VLKLFQKEKRIIGNSVVLFLSNLAQTLFSVVRQVVIARKLSPDGFGIFSILMLYYTYSTQLDLGSNNGGLQQISESQVAGKNKQVKHRLNQFRLASFSIVIALLFIAGFCNLLAVFWRSNLEIISIFIGFGAITVLVNLYSVEARIQQRFKLIAVILFANAFLALVMTVALSVYFDEVTPLAFVMVLMSSSLSTLVCYLYYFGATIEWCFDWNTIFKFFTIGFPLTVVPFIYLIFVTADRWLLSFVYDDVTIGYVGLGAMTGVMLLSLPASVSTVLYPSYFNSRDKETGSFKRIVTAVLFVSIMFSLGMVVLSGLLGGVIGLLFPQFTDGDHIIFTTLFGYSCLFPVPFLFLFLNLNKQFTVVSYTTIIFVVVKMITFVMFYQYDDVSLSLSWFIFVNAAFSATIIYLFLAFHQIQIKHIIPLIVTLFSPVFFAAIVTAYNGFGFFETAAVFSFEAYVFSILIFIGAMFGVGLIYKNQIENIDL